MQADSAQQLRTLLEGAAASVAAAGGPSDSGAAAGGGILSDPVGTAASVGQAIKHNVPLPEEAADILKTVGKLKALSPLYTYALYHPLRFLGRYVVLPVPSLVLFLVLALVDVVAFVVRLVVSPVYAAVHVATAPVRFALDVAAALLPVCIFLATAVCIGAAVGALAGLLVGGTTRRAIARAADVALWPLRVVGWVEPSSTTRAHAHGRRFGANGGARIETTLPGDKRKRSSVKVNRRSNEGGRGKGVMEREQAEMTTTDEEPDYSSHRNGYRRAQDAHSLGSSASEEEADDADVVATSGSSNGARGRSAGAKRAVTSGWRKRHVQDVLQ
ncbi:hypothetical protein JCM11491_006330 [Sporobolomyces phaffii]